ncbi:unnamed protein product [Pneumocystis jirovecii]|uniref:Uncharacterized protein n=1 Tax=Pneumocystis jirovecii TaxID=42068 RepID=L0PA49_PNEJI|nr:unnamed protein product [Pneumocystis jirovecii]
MFFMIYKLFFVCPVEDPLGNSLLICKNYHHFRSSVDPYLKSTYHEYAMEHVETVRPYLKNIQENVNKYGKPVVFHIRDKYNVYAHPYVLHMKDSAYQYIQKHIQPVGIRYFKVCNEFYKDTLKKYVIYFENIYWKSIHPTVYMSTQITYNFYKSKCITFYRQVKPYAIQLLKTTYMFCKKEVYPRIIRILFKFKDFFFSYIVPKFNLLWETHVKPQLERIYERIFQYKEIDSDTLKVQSDKRSGSSLNQNTYPKESVSKQKHNTQTSPSHLDDQLISEMLSLWTDNLNKISKGIENLLIDDLVNVLLPIIYKKEKATIQNLLTELNLLVDSEISKIKNKIISKNNVLKNVNSKDAYYNINDIKESGKAIHTKALEIRTYLKSIENDCKKKIIKKSKLSFNQIVIFQSEMVSLFEVFIKSNIKNENHKKIYDKYFNFETLINTIEKQLFDSVLNSTLSSLKQIRNLSIKAEITLNNIAGLAARQLKDFKSVNASNTIIQKLYNDSVNGKIKNVFSK